MRRNTRRNQYFSSVTQRICMKFIAVIIGCLCLLTAMSGDGEAQSSARQRVFYVAMSLGRGGLGDRSFNDAAYQGLQEAQTQYGIRFDAVPFVSEERSIEELTDFALQGYDVIMGIGFENAPVIETLAKEFPDLQFAIIDSAVTAENVASFVFREQEGDFLTLVRQSPSQKAC